MEKFKILGFDIGITSIGWAFLEGKDNGELELKDCGVRIFTKAEQPKTGKSLALPRREARGVRRRLSRRRARLNALKRLICAEFGLDIKDYLAPDGELPRAFSAGKADSSNALKSPYQLRAEALERKLSAEELARVILHIAKHRGYGNKHAKDDFTDELLKKSEDSSQNAENPSNETKQNTKKARKSKNETKDKDDDESAKVKKAIEANLDKFDKFKQSGGRTWGEYLYKEVYQKLRTPEQIAEREEESQISQSQIQFINVRNKAGNYARCVTQKMLRDELRRIFEAQRKFGFTFSNTLSNKIPHLLKNILKDREDEIDKLNFEEAVFEIAFWQRPLKSVENMVGYCTFYCEGDNKEKRAPKDSPSAIEFVALTTIINTLHNIVKNHTIDAFIYDKQTGEIYDKDKILTELKQKIPEIKKAIFERDSFTYSDLRKILGLENAEGIRFGDKRLDYVNHIKPSEWDIAKSIFEKLKDKTIKLDKEITSKKDIESLRAVILETFNLNAKKIAEYILVINDKDISQDSDKLEKLKENLKQSCPNLKDSQIKKLDKIKIANAEDIPFIETNKIKLFKQFQKAFGDKYDEFDRETLDKIATDINLIKNRDELKETLKEKYPALDDLMIEKLSRLDFSKYNNLSLKALGKILPFMRGDSEEKGGNGQYLRYDDAVKEAQKRGMPKGKSFTKGDFLPPLKDFEENLANPVVARALSEFRKVCNALLKKYGKVHRIHIEFTREVGKNFITRNKWINQQNENAQKKQNAHNLCLQYGLPINPTNLLKAQLFIEQGEFCVYSGKKITKEHLLDSTALQIDHIYPYSRSFDDSYLNKVLVFTKENQHKTNQTPFEAWGNTPKWEIIESFVSGCKNLNKKKAQRILDKHFKDKESKGFKDRNLNDTSYIANLTKDYVSKCLKFADEEENDNKVRVQVRSGALTSMLRHYWGLDTILDSKSNEDSTKSAHTEAQDEISAESNADSIKEETKKLESSDKKDRSNHLHHAIDAIIIAYATQAMVQNFSNFKSEEEKCRLKFYKKFKEEFEKANTEQYSQSEFKEQLKEKLKIYKKYRQKKLNDYKRLKSPNEHIHQIVKNKVLGIRGANNELVKNDNGEILEKGIFVSKPPRKRVRGALHEETMLSLDSPKILKDYGGKEGVKRAISLGKIRALNPKYDENGELISAKIVSNGSMPRVDIFKRVENGKVKFYGVPIYTMDFARGVLPNKAVVSSKAGTIKDWLEMDESKGFTFCFSLFKDDLILIQKADMKKEELAYFVKFDASGGKIDITKHDNYFANLTENQKILFPKATKEKVEARGIGIQSLKVFKKMKVSPLGEVSEAKLEPREDCKLKTSKKSKRNLSQDSSEDSTNGGENV